MAADLLPVTSPSHSKRMSKVRRSGTAPAEPEIRTANRGSRLDTERQRAHCADAIHLAHLPSSEPPVTGADNFPINCAIRALVRRRNHPARPVPRRLRGQLLTIDEAHRKPACRLRPNRPTQIPNPERAQTSPRARLVPDPMPASLTLRELPHCGDLDGQLMPPDFPPAKLPH